MHTTARARSEHNATTGGSRPPLLWGIDDADTRGLHVAPYPSCDAVKHKQTADLVPQPLRLECSRP